MPRKKMISRAETWIPLSLILLILLILPTRLPRMYSRFVSNLALIELEKVVVNEQNVSIDARDEMHGILEKLELAQQGQPDYGRNLRNYGIALREAGELRRAASVFETAIETMPEDKIARLFLGDVIFDLGNVERARAIWADTPECSILMYRVFSHVMKDDLRTAEYLLDSPCDAALDSAFVANALVETYALLQNDAILTGDQDWLEEICDSGSQIYEQLLSMEASDYRTHIGFGKFLRECGQVSEALAHFVMAEESGQLTLRAMANVESGLTHTQMGNVAEALPHFELAVQFQPDNAGYRIMYGHALAQAGRREEALKEFGVATESSILPWRSWAYGEMGLVYQDSGDWLLAISSYEQAVDLDPSRDDYRVLLGKALATIGDVEEARNHLTDALDSTNATWQRLARQELDRLENK